MKVFKKVFLMFFSLLIFHLGFNSILFAENINENEKKLVYVENIFYDENGKSANGWYNDGTEWYFFKDGKKHTGFATDGNGKMYFKNGKYGTAYVDKIFYEEGKTANGWYDDGSDWYFFKNGKKYTGFATDGNGKMYFKDGKYGKGYVDKVFYGEGKPADWWYDDGTGWYFFQKGEKFTGIAEDKSGYKYFVKGKYGSGIYKDILYKDGVKSAGRVYVGNLFYGDDAKPANWWYNDGTAWYFFKDGKKYTGKAVDGNGEMQFVKGKYANTYIEGIFYRDGKIANWWCDDGEAWYFFQNGKKFTGIGIDASGMKYFVGGKYANGIYDEKLYKNGLKSEGKTYVNGIYYDENKLPANGWYDDGYDWFFFKNGKKHTGKAIDGNGEMDFVNGKYKNNRRYYMASEEVQMRILNAAYNTSSPGRNLCAKWVSKVYQNAGLGYLGGNANDMYKKYAFTTEIGKLKIGMIVAVESSSSGGRMGRIYGHVGIYIGDGKVMESIGYKRIITLDYWISTYCQHHPVGFGYPPSVEK